MTYSLRKCAFFFALLASALPAMAGAWEWPQTPNCAKVDIGPAYVHMDVLESGVTVHHMDMAAVRLDATFVFCGGFTFKPMLMAARGEGELYTASAALGYSVPLATWFAMTPQAGIGYSYLNTKFERNIFGLSLLTEHTYKSYSPFAGIDLIFILGSGWRAGGSILYAWANTRTDLTELGQKNIRSESQGFAYAASIEKDITDNLSISLSGGYNNTLSKEKHGLRGYGAKLGLAYWF